MEALVGALEGALVGALVGAGSTRGGTGGGCWNTLIIRKKSLSHQLKVLSSNLIASDVTLLMVLVITNSC